MLPVTFSGTPSHSTGAYSASQNTQAKSLSAALRTAKQSRDSIRFGAGDGKTAEQTNQQPGFGEKVWNWTKKQPKVWMKSVGAALKLGGWWPTKGIVPDVIWSTVITLPLCILPGSQLFFIPTWIAMGAAWRGAKTLLKGTFNPDSILNPKKD